MQLMFLHAGEVFNNVVWAERLNAHEYICVCTPPHYPAPPD